MPGLLDFFILDWACSENALSSAKKINLGERTRESKFT